MQNSFPEGAFLHKHHEKLFITQKETRTDHSFLYENDHFNQAQAEFKKESNGQSKPVAQKKRRKKRRVCTIHSGSGLSAWYTPSDHLSPSIALLLQLGVWVAVKKFTLSFK